MLVLYFKLQQHHTILFIFYLFVLLFFFYAGEPVVKLQDITLNSGNVTVTWLFESQLTSLASGGDSSYNVRSILLF